MVPLTLNIPDYWTDEEALVVFEFIDEIREQIWNNYGTQIQSTVRLTRRVSPAMEDRGNNNRQIDLFDEIIF